MDQLIIPYAQCSSSKEAYQAVQQNVQKVLSQWKVNADITCQDEQQKIHAKGTGFSMNMTFGEKEAIAKISLSFPLSALKKTILPPLEKELKKHL